MRQLYWKCSYLSNVHIVITETSIYIKGYRILSWFMLFHNFLSHTFPILIYQQFQNVFENDNMQGCLLLLNKMDYSLNITNIANIWQYSALDAYSTCTIKITLWMNIYRQIDLTFVYDFMALVRRGSWTGVCICIYYTNTHPAHLFPYNQTQYSIVVA